MRVRRACGGASDDTLAVRRLEWRFTAEDVFAEGMNRQQGGLVSSVLNGRPLPNPRPCVRLFEDTHASRSEIRYVRLLSRVLLGLLARAKSGFEVVATKSPNPPGWSYVAHTEAGASALFRGLFRFVVTLV